MNRKSKGLLITAIILTIILVISSVMTMNRWNNLLEKERIIQELNAEYDRIVETTYTELLLELEELKSK